MIALEPLDFLADRSNPIVDLPLVKPGQLRPKTGQQQPD